MLLLSQLLDTGVAFDENYLATSGAIITYRKATNWVRSIFVGWALESCGLCHLPR